jgi:hypothetical protein
MKASIRKIGDEDYPWVIRLDAWYGIACRSFEQAVRLLKDFKAG